MLLLLLLFLLHVYKLLQIYDKSDAAKHRLLSLGTTVAMRRIRACEMSMHGWGGAGAGKETPHRDMLTTHPRRRREDIYTPLYHVLTYRKASIYILLCWDRDRSGGWGHSVPLRHQMV